MAESSVTETMGRHTPGPWRIDNPIRGYAHSVLAQSTTHPQYNVACADVPQGRDADGEEALGNARLIAAAPDMLAALKAVVAFAGTVCLTDHLNPCWDNRPTDTPGRHWSSEPGHPVAACVVCTARGLIARVEGRS